MSAEIVNNGINSFDIDNKIIWITPHKKPHDMNNRLSNCVNK